MDMGGPAHRAGGVGSSHNTPGGSINSIGGTPVLSGSAGASLPPALAQTPTAGLAPNLRHDVSTCPSPSPSKKSNRISYCKEQAVHVERRSQLQEIGWSMR